MRGTVRMDSAWVSGDSDATLSDDLASGQQVMLPRGSALHQAGGLAPSAVGRRIGQVGAVGALLKRQHQGHGGVEGRARQASAAARGAARESATAAGGRRRGQHALCAGRFIVPPCAAGRCRLRR
jgi:hypothetical protein